MRTGAKVADEGPIVDNPPVTLPVTIRPVLLLALAGGALGVMAGCRPRAPRQPLLDTDPIFVIPAIRNVADADRLRDAPRLIELLESEDAAVRLAAINSLRDLTGEDFGYHFWQRAGERGPAVDRWRQWAVARGLVQPE